MIRDLLTTRPFDSYYVDPELTVDKIMSNPSKIAKHFMASNHSSEYKYHLNINNENNQTDGNIVGGGGNIEKRVIYLTFSTPLPFKGLTPNPGMTIFEERPGLAARAFFKMAACCFCWMSEDG